MKLRIRGNTIRFRLTQSEIKQLSEEGLVEDAVEFSSSSKMTYRILSGSYSQISASFENNTISVYVPVQVFNAWAGSDQAGIENGEYGLVPLFILIEKDFQCLKARPGDEDKDAFPNPLSIDITE